MTDETIKLPKPTKYLRAPGHVLLPWDVAAASPPQESSAGWFPVFTADQVRAAVLEAKAQERERLALLVESMWEVDGSHTASLFAAAIRSGHSITETKRD